MGNAIVGRLVDEVHFDIERGKIGEFCRATGTRDLVHTDPVTAEESGFSDVLATATHTVVAGHLRDQRGFVAGLALAIERVVVGSVAWEYLRPLVAGDSVTAARRVVGDEHRAGRQGGQLRMVTLLTEYTDARGEVAVRVREVLIERGASA